MHAGQMSSLSILFVATSGSSPSPSMPAPHAAAGSAAVGASGRAGGRRKRREGKGTRERDGDRPPTAAERGAAAHNGGREAAAPGAAGGGHARRQRPGRGQARLGTAAALGPSPRGGDDLGTQTFARSPRDTAPKDPPRRQRPPGAWLPVPSRPVLTTCALTTACLLPHRHPKCPLHHSRGEPRPLRSPGPPCGGYF